MAVQWVAVCTQDVAPGFAGGMLDCGSGTVQVVPYQYLDASGAALSGILNLDASDATAIGFAVIGVWAIAWSFKMLIRTLGSHENVEE